MKTKRCDSTIDAFSDRMEPDQIKRLLKDRGWLAKEVAERWELGERRMSQIINDRSRKQYYDDAFAGLPKNL